MANIYWKHLNFKKGIINANINTLSMTGGKLNFIKSIDDLNLNNKPNHRSITFKKNKGSGNIKFIL